MAFPTEDCDSWETEENFTLKFFSFTCTAAAPTQTYGCKVATFAAPLDN